MTHELAEIFREQDGMWVVRCSCGWDCYSGRRQQKFALAYFSDHVAEMEETRLVNP